MSVSEALFEKVDKRLDMLPRTVVQVAKPALAKLREAAPAIDRLGTRALRDGLSVLAFDWTDLPAATAGTIEHFDGIGDLDFATRRSLFQNASAEALRERKQREEDAAAVVKALWSAGETAMRAAIPIILSVV
jgi:hypothetical protein